MLCEWVGIVVPVPVDNTKRGDDVAADRVVVDDACDGDGKGGEHNHAVDTVPLSMVLGTGSSWLIVVPVRVGGYLVGVC